jgi:ArsR family metal-binding transcriptional regulator
VCSIIGEENVLIENYDLELFTPPCHPGVETWSAVARLEVDISQVLPYLNATLPGAIYNQAARALTWKKEGRNSAFHAFEIAASKLEDRAEAEQIIAGLVKMVNQTWARRAEIEPDFEMRQRPTPMAIFKLLPGTNCQACGQPTCFNFALQLAAGQQKLDQCPPLLEPACAERLAQLRAMVIDES